MKLIKDAIHDSIEVSALELQIIDSPLVQRLRFVKQLSTAYLVYPSANHSRFEHSLGAMHLTGVLCNLLGVEQSKKEELRLAALLHDVGHAAFSHVSEPLLHRLTGHNHEERGIKLVRESGLGELVERNGHSLSGLQPLLEGNGEGAIVTSELGTDRMDYLLRDSHFTGVAYSIIDADRLLRTLEYKDGELFVQERGVLAAESLLVSRYFMFNAVYHHPTVRIAGEMAVKALENGIEDGKTSVGEVERGGDFELLYKLSQSGSALASGVLERKLYKSCVEVEMERALRATGAKNGEGLRKILQEEFEAKEMDGILFCIQEKPKGERKAKVLHKDGSFSLLADASPVVKSLEERKPGQTLIVAAPAKEREMVKAAAEGIIGA